MKNVGRPMRYAVIIRRLEEDTLYSASTIAQFAQDEGLLHLFVDDKVTERQARNRIRLAMVRLCNQHRFPDEGDGKVVITGQAPVSGWYGWRWKDLLPF